MADPWEWIAVNRLIPILRRIFTRPVRASLYAVALAAFTSLVAAGKIPAWAAPVAAPFLLALLNLTPKDVEKDDGGGDA